MVREKVIFCWSGGKDSVMALYEAQKSGNYEILSLLTTTTEDYKRVSMHGVRNELVQQQAEALDLSLLKMRISKDSTNKEYEFNMKRALFGFKAKGARSVIFGDIFLENLRQYREENLKQVGMKAIFPIWKKDTKELVKEFVNLGFRAIVTCVDSKVLDKSFVGCEINDQFISRLPEGIDPCGENGEFHSFVFDGPIFKEKIDVSIGEIVKRDAFYFCDLASK